jgi:uncharacterized protein
MKIRFSVFLILIAIAGAGYCQTVADSTTLKYNQAIDNYRRGKNIKLMYGDATPLLPEQQKNFKGLNYFAPDRDYLVEATLVKSARQQDVAMKTSGDRTPVYVRYGVATFMLKGKPYTLAVFRNKKMLELSQDTSSLFIPFRDETCGTESYGGGRYIDCEIPASGNKVKLDFNKAYNPYCAYNPNYSCVIPPEENRLPLRIEAGEMVFEEH